MKTTLKINQILKIRDTLQNLDCPIYVVENTRVGKTLRQRKQFCILMLDEELMFRREMNRGKKVIKDV